MKLRKPNRTKRMMKPVISKREMKVLEHLSEGKTHKEIADRLCISPKTASTHVHNIGRKLQINKETRLVSWYIRRKYGILEI